MKKTTWQKGFAIFAFWLTISAFLIFFLYMGTAEKVSIYQAEEHLGYITLNDIEPELVSDPDAPAGLRKVYHWTFDDVQSQNDTLCFYVSHHNIQVYFDDALMFSLTGDKGNRIGRNVSSNWCSIHVGQEHAGRDVTVILTPLFDAAVSKNPEFLFGAHYSIAFAVLYSELSPLIFSILCLVLGVVLIAVSLYFYCIMRAPTHNLLYLGLFSVFLGLWKITDLSFLPMLLPESAMAMGYISVGSLFMTGLTLMMYFSTMFTDKGQRPLQIMALAGCLISFLILVLQVIGAAELRQNLLFCHGILVVSVLSVPLTAGLNRLFYHKSCLDHSWRVMLLLLLLGGIVLDLALFYQNYNSGLLSFTITGFVIYTLVVFTGSVQSATRKAYTDVHTGLVNRARWNELMNSDSAMYFPYGILMIDLNGLKRVNDTLGHDAGDQMIFQLSCILRNTLPRASVICRWGGDEFAVLLSDVDRPKLDRHIAELITAGKKYNTDHPELPLHFSLGAALSTEHPDLSRSELFRLADEEMYRSKAEWYADIK